MRKKVYKSLLLIIVVIALAICGIYKFRYLPNHLSKETVKIIQRELFEGDTKKLEPQLHYFSVADIVLKYNTEKKGIAIYYEEYKNGEIVKRYPITELYDLKEITVTAKESEGQDGYKVRTVIYDKDGYMNTAFDINKPNIELKYGSKKLHRKLEVDTEDIGLWGIIGQNDPYYWKSGESVIDMAKRSVWGIVLKIEFSDELEHLPK
ncbi:MAG: hypothetical protein N4A50_09655 [Vallitalea sp.]|jgi:hypothetical protein|nr:hypothetical protein [Vallitalea sp.]